MAVYRKEAKPSDSVLETAERSTSFDPPAVGQNQLTRLARELVEGCFRDSRQCQRIVYLDASRRFVKPHAPGYAVGQRLVRVFHPLKFETWRIFIAQMSF